MDEQPETRPGGWALRPSDQQVTVPLDVDVPLTLPGRDPAPQLALIFAADGAYLPAVVQRPDRPGPHPLVICVHGGTGGLGVGYLLELVTEHGWLYEELLDRGYAVCVTEGRREIEDAYGQGLPCPLDHHDLVGIVEHMRGRGDIDADRIGYIGVSHGGELGAKAISEMGSGIAALVLCEPAAIEFLGLHVRHASAPRGERNLAFYDAVDDEAIDVAWASERIARIDPATAVLVCGRDGDHLQGLFLKLHELLRRGGIAAEWESWDHPEHVFVWGPPKSDGGYDPDEIQRASRDRIVEFLAQALR